METFKTTSPRATGKLGQKLARRFSPGDLIALVGPLGAGKTALVRGLASGWGIEDQRTVSSPTYVLVHEYPGEAFSVFHLDLYRMSMPDAELADLGLAEMLEDGVVAIEWADRADNALPKPHWQMTIEITGANSRIFTLEQVE